LHRRIDVPAEQVLQVAIDHGERSAQLVGYIGNEITANAFGALKRRDIAQ
jgi:hypothetical protein